MTVPALVTAQNSGRSARAAALAVQARSGAVRRWLPGVDRGGRADRWVCGVGADRDALARSVLVGLGAADGDEQAAAGDGFQIAEGEADQFRAAQRGAEA